MAIESSVLFVNGILNANGVADNEIAIATLMGYASATFVLDRTSSMKDHIGPAKAAIAQKINELRDTDDAPAEYILYAFDDPLEGEPLIFKDADACLAALASVEASEPNFNNEWCEEPSMEALLRAVKASAPVTSIYLYTDASSSDPELEAAVAAASNEKRIRQDVRLFGSCSPVDPAYVRLTEETGGQLFFIGSGEMATAADLILPQGAGEQATIRRTVSSVDGTTTLNVPVESGVSSLTVETSIGPVWLDADLYQFTGSAGQTLVAEVRAQRLGSTLDSILAVLDSDGQAVLAENDDTFGLDSQITFTLPQDGTFYLQVASYSAGSQPGRFYELSLRDSAVSGDSDGGDEAEPNDLPEEASAIAVGTFLSGIIEDRRDLDVWQFSGTEGEPIVAEVRASRIGSPLDSELWLLDSDGETSLAHNNNTYSRDPRIEYTLPHDGTFYLRVGTYDDSPGSPNYLYRLSLRPPSVSGGDEAEPNDSPVAASSIAYDTFVGGLLEAESEVDFFGFSGSTGESIIADVRTTGGETYIVSRLSLYDSDGTTLLATNTDLYSWHPRIELILPHNGTFYLKIEDGDYPFDHPTVDYHYDLHLVRTDAVLEAGDEAEPNDSSANAGQLSQSTAVRGVIGQVGAVEIAVLRPSGASVAPGDSDAAISTLSTGSIVRIANPEAGAWQVRLEGAGRYTTLVTAIAPLQFLDFSYVTRQGAPGHEGLARLEEAPVADSSQTASAVLTGSPMTASFRFIDDDDETIADLTLLSDDPMAGAEEFVGPVAVPTQPYRVAVSGLDQQGLPYERVYPAKFGTRSVEIERVAGPEVLPRGETTTLTFAVRSIEASRQFEFLIDDDFYWVSRVEPLVAQLPSGETVLVEVDVSVPFSAEPGEAVAVWAEVTPTDLPLDYRNAVASTSVTLTVAQCPFSCDPIDACHLPGQCDEVTQVCSNPIAVDTSPCEDGDPCTLGDSCLAGACSSGTQKDCSHMNSPCGSGVCDLDGDCVLAPYAGDWCSDGVFCNGADQCVDGACSEHAGDPCADDGLVCDENHDRCNEPDGTPCDDGLFCNGTDSWLGGECAVHAGAPCPEADGDSNCAESCDETARACTASDMDGTACNDDLFCTVEDQCAAGLCVGTGDPCSGGGECSNLCSEPLDICNLEAGTACGDDGNPCTQDRCDGAGGCSHPPGNAGAVCRFSAGVCDPPESCNGADSACPVDVLTASSTVCRNAGGICDVAESCTGTSADCPSDHLASSTITCRASVDVCDAAENCTGAGAACPADSMRSSATICRAAAGSCDVVDSCTGTSTGCPADAFLASATECRAVAGVCDLAESCSGISAQCPSDTFASSGVTCRTVAGVCDVAETCSGTSAPCPADTFTASTSICRASTGVCDITESCTGSAAACPADAFRSSTTLCRASGGVCDLVENCTGSAGTCPADAVAPSTTICRPAAGACDLVEKCTGASGSCPTNQLAAANTPCASDGNVCTNDVCTGSSAACSYPPNTAPCSDGLFCNGTDTCAGGACGHSGDPCTPNFNQTGKCSDFVCNEQTDSCQLPADGIPCPPDGNSCTEDLCDGQGGCYMPFCATCPAAPIRHSFCEDVHLGILDYKKFPDASSKNRLLFRSAKGVIAAPSILGDPVTGSTGYALCVYSNGTLVQSLTLQPQDLCSGVECWSRNADQILYRDKSKNPATGVRTFQLRAKSSGALSAKVVGRGTSLTMPSNLQSLGASGPVIAQIVSTTQIAENTRCWEAYLLPPNKLESRRYRAEIAQ